jgi:hypothetical protein
LLTFFAFAFAPLFTGTLREAAEAGLPAALAVLAILGAFFAALAGCFFAAFAAGFAAAFAAFGAAVPAFFGCAAFAAGLFPFGAAFAIFRITPSLRS